MVGHESITTWATSRMVDPTMSTMLRQVVVAALGLWGQQLVTVAQMVPILMGQTVVDESLTSSTMGTCQPGPSFQELQYSLSHSSACPWHLATAGLMSQPIISPALTLLTTFYSSWTTPDSCYAKAQSATVTIRLPTELQTRTRACVLAPTK